MKWCNTPKAVFETQSPLAICRVIRSTKDHSTPVAPGFTGGPRQLVEYANGQDTDDPQG